MHAPVCVAPVCPCRLYAWADRAPSRRVLYARLYKATRRGNRVGEIEKIIAIDSDSILNQLSPSGALELDSFRRSARRNTITNLSSFALRVPIYRRQIFSFSQIKRTNAIIIVLRRTSAARSATREIPSDCPVASRSTAMPAMPIPISTVTKR